MSEDWRRKSYYRPRVLLDTARILAPQFDDELLCITGPQIEMLRNLTQYLRRRSTFASEYHDNHYLAPTNAEWDTIQAIVADLEETLMGCSELADALTAIAAQLNCICLAINSGLVQGQPQDDGYSGQGYYDDYISSTVEDTGAAPGALPSWDAFRAAKCKGSQKLVDDIAQAVQQMGASLTSGILITFSIINGMLVLTVISIPISIVLQIVTTLVAIGTSIAYNDVVDWLVDNKESLVCAIYNSKTASAAYSAVQAYIDGNWDAGAGIAIVKSMFSYQALSDIYDYTQRDFDDWEENYDAAYCDSCTDIEEATEFIWTWPPCPSSHHADGGVCDESRKCFNALVDDAHQEHIVDAGTYNQVTIEIRWRSMHPSGWTVGGVAVEWYDVGVPEWTQVAHESATNSQPAGSLNTATAVLPLAPPQAGGLTRSRIHGTAGQTQSNPYPFQVEYVRLKYETV